MRIQFKRILRVSPFVLTLSALLVVIGSSLAYAPTSADTISVIPNGNKEYTALCSALKAISDGDLARTNCRLWATQRDQDKAVKNICATGTGKTKLKDECKAYTAALSAAKAAKASAAGTTAGYTPTSAETCGGPDDNPVELSISIGCKGLGNPIVDAAFAFIRFLSDGAGLVLIGSLVYAGIQYTLSRGDPQSTAMAVNRMRSVFVSLLIFIFAYAILNYLIPGQVLQ